MVLHPYMISSLLEYLKVISYFLLMYVFDVLRAIFKNLTDN